jgi:hypothetical protein
MSESEKHSKHSPQIGGTGIPCPFCEHEACICGWCHCTGKYHGLRIVQSARSRYSEEELRKIEEEHKQMIMVKFGKKKKKQEEVV